MSEMSAAGEAPPPAPSHGMFARNATGLVRGVTPRSSLIISDEELSPETGKGTDFVVILSNEPQGGIAMRRRSPASEFRYVRSRDRGPFSWRSPFGGAFSTW